MELCVRDGQFEHGKSRLKRPKKLCNWLMTDRKSCNNPLSGLLFEL
jgi:hypothetical protein